MKPVGPRLLEGVVAAVGERAPGPVVDAARQVALGDPDVVRDPALGDDRVVAARRLAGVGRDVEEDPVLLGPVVDAEVHRVVERVRPAGELRDGVGDDPQADGEPAVVDRGEDRRQRGAGRRPLRELRARPVVVPVEELAARVVALHALERGQRPRGALAQLALADDPEPLRGDRAPQVRADVRRRRLHLAAAVGEQLVGGEARRRVGHRRHRRPRAGGVAPQRVLVVARRRCRRERGGQRAGEHRRPCDPHLEASLGTRYPTSRRRSPRPDAGRLAGDHAVGADPPRPHAQEARAGALRAVGEDLREVVAERRAARRGSAATPRRARPGRPPRRRRTRPRRCRAPGPSRSRRRSGAWARWATLSGVGRVIAQPVRPSPSRAQIGCRTRERGRDAAVDRGDGGPHDAVGDVDELVERVHAVAA